MGSVNARLLDAGSGSRVAPSGDEGELPIEPWARSDS